MKKIILILTILARITHAQVEVTPVDTNVSHVFPEELRLTTAEMRSKYEQEVRFIVGNTYSPDGTLLEGGDGVTSFNVEIDATDGVSQNEILDAINSQPLSFNVTRIQTRLWFYVYCYGVGEDGNWVPLLHGKTQFETVLRETPQGNQWVIDEDSRRLKLELAEEKLSFHIPGAVNARMSVRGPNGEQVASQSIYYLDVDHETSRISIERGLLDAPGGEIIIGVIQPDGRYEEIAYRLGPKGGERITPINIVGAARAEGIEGILTVRPGAFGIHIQMDADGFGVNPVLETKVTDTSAFYTLSATTSDGNPVRFVRVYRLTGGERILEGTYNVSPPNPAGWQTAIRFQSQGLYHLIYTFERPIRERGYPDYWGGQKGG